jgi:hypothetical protein
MRQVVDHERAERDVEGAVGERQVLGVAVDELDLRMAPAGLGEHAVGEIDAGDERSTRASRRSQRAEPAADVEHAHARCHAGGVEQRLDGERRRARHQRVVGARTSAPALGFEGLERRAGGGVGVGDAHAPTAASSHGAAPPRTAAATAGRRFVSIASRSSAISRWM